MAITISSDKGREDAMTQINAWNKLISQEGQSSANIKLLQNSIAENAKAIEIWDNNKKANTKTTTQTPPSTTAAAKADANKAPTPSMDAIIKWQTVYQPKATDIINLEGTYKQLKWPDTLGTDRYPHFVTFFINEHTAAGVAREGNTVNDVDLSNRTAGVSLSSVVGGLDLNLKTFTNAGQTLLSNLGVIMGETAATVASQQKVDNQPQQKDPAVTKANADAAAASEKERQAKGLNDNLFTSKRKRLKNCISLPMPRQIRANYSAGYTESDPMGGAGAVFLDALQGNKDAGARATLQRALVPGIGKGMIELGKEIPVVGSFIQDIPPNMFEQILNKTQGNVFNTRQEQLFKNMNFRQHQFSWLFIPRNLKESDEINSIIRTFKFFMHPALTQGGSTSLLITPAEFDIDFRYKNHSNESISKIATCALAACDVDYTSIGEFIAFEGTENPVAITLDLTFVEMEPLNRSMILGGF